MLEEVGEKVEQREKNSQWFPFLRVIDLGRSGDSTKESMISKSDENRSR